MSNIATNKKLNAEWKAKLEKKTLKFSSLTSWFFYFNKIRKKKIIIFNYMPTVDLNSFIINLLVKLSKLPVMLSEVAVPFSIYKKNIHFFFSRIKEHGFNYKVYLFYLKLYFFGFLNNLIKYEKIYLFSNGFYKKNYDYLYGSKKENFVKIDFNAWDYSNALATKQNKKNDW